MNFRTLLSLSFASLALTTGQARSSIAYGSINNFDTVNDTGHECHGFEIELEDCHSTDITYTYNYNHYGVPNMTEDNSVAGHPRCVIRWESKKNADGSWAAFTAIPSGPIAPTNGHMFTNPSVNFGGEHFGVGYRVQPTAVRYHWLIDNGSGVLVNGGDVQVSTPTFTYFPPAAGAVAQVQAIIPAPEPPEVHVKEFGDPVWMKEIRTTSHNNNEVKLRDLVSDDPDDANDKNWRNGEPDEVEVEWQLLQTEFAQVDGGANGELAAAPEDLNDGDEVVTRRYEFFKYTGPLDNETGEAMADNIGPDDLHGVGSKEINGVLVDLSTVEVVGDYIGAQMAAVDVDASVGLIDHVGDGRINSAYTARTVVVAGAAPFTSTMNGVLPNGMSFNAASGVLSGTPTQSGEFSITVKASDTNTPEKSKTYTFSVAAAGEQIAPHSLLDTTSVPVAGGTTTGSDSYEVGTNATVTATANPGYSFLNWTDDGQIVSTDPSYTLTMDVNHSLVANFVAGHIITLDADPAEGGVVAGGGAIDDGTSVTVTATPNGGFTFVNWTESGVPVSASASYTFTVTASRTLVAHFSAAAVYAVTTSSTPAAGGTTTGGGNYASGTSATVTATPTVGYAFSNWTVGGAVVSASASYTFTVTANHALVANFAPDGGMQTITTSSNPTGGGTTTGAGSYATGAVCTVTATPNANYMFKRWQESGVTVSNSTTYSFTVAANRALVAKFARIYAVTTSSNPPAGGTTLVEGSFEDGDNVTVTATANPGYTFVSWTENGAVVSEDAVYEFKANPARNLTANFSGGGPLNYSISLAAQPSSAGTVSGGGTFPEGSAITVHATPALGYQFARWMEAGVEMSTEASFTLTADADHALVAVFSPEITGVHFDFDTGAIPVAPGAPLPIDQMSGGITANFSSPDAGGYSISSLSTSGYTLSGFSGNYLSPGVDGTVVEFVLDQAVLGVTIQFALLESKPLAAHSTVKLTTYDSSSGAPLEVGSVEVQGVETPGDSLAGGSLTFEGLAPFNGVRLEVLTPVEEDSRLLCDNISVTPQSPGGFLTLANPNWSITLTDSGYSDYLIDNTPGFEGREYLSGEWGAAVGYTVGNSSKSPRWLEANFVYPDWNTNSDFVVIMPITLTSSNADGLPIAQSVIANDDLEITLRYEMIDTVTGMPLGVVADSAAGAGNSVSSNRYVLNQSYTVKNISGKTVSNLQIFQLLHGLTSQHGVFDSRLYSGRFSNYRFDATLAGVDVGTIGADGSSASGLEDYISFSATTLPSAFEIGHYGIEGIDDHSNGKPSDGVHLSIEDNWSSAPYTSRINRDYFAPGDRWIAGGQRYNLGTLADGQSVTIDVMLSILTGTTVQVVGGGGGTHTGSGSCNGGSSHVGGVDFEIEDVEEDGTFFGEESEADDDEMDDRIEDGEFVLPNFQQPGGLSQVWNLRYTGTHNGRIRLTFAYDPALIPPGFDESGLTMYHFHDGAWEQMVGQVDESRHTITVTTETLSPFMLGVASAQAVPSLASTVLNTNTLRLSWQGDTTGWILQESTDLANGWVNSTAPVVQVGNTYQAEVSCGRQRCFYRLVHP